MFRILQFLKKQKKEKNNQLNKKNKNHTQKKNKKNIIYIPQRKSCYQQDATLWNIQKSNCNIIELVGLLYILQTVLTIMQ